MLPFQKTCGVNFGLVWLSWLGLFEPSSVCAMSGTRSCIFMSEACQELSQ